MTSQQDTALEKIANLYEKNPIVRLSCSCYETITGGFLDYAGGKGKLTPRFNEFLNWLQVTANEIEPDEHLRTMAAGYR